jgi:thymidylate synthase
MDEELEKRLQLSLRRDGKIPIISVEADNLAEATHKSIIACHDYGVRIETPKQREGMTLGYDANMLIEVKNPDSEPKIYNPGIQDDARGIMQYILEVTHGIHNHWKKSKEHPDRWGYTYNERFLDQLPFVFQRIKADWEAKKGRWGERRGAISGRDYQFAIWRAGEDIILGQQDPPCFQLGNLRFLLDDKGELVMNYQTNWRSRDLLKAWNDNNIAQVELMKLFKDKISNILDVPIKLGSYIDHSDSLHLYGMYIDRDNLENQVAQMKRDGYENQSMSLEDYFLYTLPGKTAEEFKGLIHAQSLAEKDGHGLNQPESFLIEKGYDLKSYPKEWDSWDPRWDKEPDATKLARVI